MKVNGLQIKKLKEDVYRLRHEHDAVVTGRKTIEADDPLYTTKGARWQKSDKGDSIENRRYQF